MKQHGIKYAAQKPTYFSRSGVESAKKPTTFTALYLMSEPFESVSEDRYRIQTSRTHCKYM